MCLITIAATERPSIEDMQKAAKQNGDGIGISWREGQNVRYLKGMDKVELIHNFVSELPMPFVIHYRWASSGGKSVKLCHPFPITKNVELATKGTVKAVLFHNGHISDWKDDLALLALTRNEALPEGEWSDTRAITWIVARLTETFLETQEGKWVFFSKEKCTMYGTGWEEVNKGAMYHSNNSWKWPGSYQSPCVTPTTPTTATPPILTQDMIKASNERFDDWKKRKENAKKHEHSRFPDWSGYGGENWMH